MSARKQVQDIFGRASELAPREREAYLERACGEDTALRREVEELLHDLDEAGDFLEESLTDLLCPADTPLGGDVGEVIGDYRLIRPLGSGGMGHVYLAERIDTFCKVLAVRERVQLLLKVCEAVTYAHSRLVVHRDIKPSNILVTDEGEPKLLDFGIAKPLEGGHSLTRGQAPMTLRYASPEQITGEPITTATDVYGLGLLLFRLLTGQWPYASGSDNAVVVARAIVEEEPARPSARGADEAVGDLDAIVGKALRKAPSDRYASVAAFSEDLGLYLEGMPVQVRGTETWYRARRLVRRFRLPIGVAASFLAMMFAFLLVLVMERGRTARERDRAEQERDTAQQTLTLFKDAFKVTDPEFARGQEVTARQILDQAGPKVRTATDPNVRATLLSAMGEVYTSLGLFETAEPYLREALELRRELGPALHAEGLYRLGELTFHRRDYGAAAEHYREALTVMPEGRSIERARALRGLGRSLRATGDLEVGVEHLEAAREVLEDEFGPTHPEVLSCIVGLGLAARDRGDYEKAAALFGELVAALRPGGPGPALARSLADLGDVRYRQGKLQEARALHEEALPILRRSMGVDNSYVAEVLGKLVAVLGRLGDDESAEQAIREILAALPVDHPGRGTALHNLGMILTNRGDLDEAERVAIEAIRIKRKIFGDKPEKIALSLCLLGRILLNGGDANVARENFETCAAIYPPEHPQLIFPLLGIGRSVETVEGCMKAKDWYERAYNHGKEKLGQQHVQTARAAGHLGECLSKLGEFEEAEDLLTKSLDALRSQSLAEDDLRIVEAKKRLEDLQAAKVKGD